jgi:hypothetical protein
MSGDDDAPVNVPLAVIELAEKHDISIEAALELYHHRSGRY